MSFNVSARSPQGSSELAAVGLEALKGTTAFAAGAFGGGDRFAFMGAVGANRLGMCGGPIIGKQAFEIGFAGGETLQHIAEIAPCHCRRSSAGDQFVIGDSGELMVLLV